MAIARYHGSVARGLIYQVYQPLRQRLRAIVRRLTQDPESFVPPEVEALLREAGSLSGEGRWSDALELVRKAADIAERGDNLRARRNVGHDLVRLGDCRRGLRLLDLPIQLQEPARRWRSEDLSGKTLFVGQLRKSNMGSPIRLGRFVAQAEKRAEGCIVSVEKRLVPILRRSFPGVEVRAMENRATPEPGEDVLVTSFEGLAADCVTDWASMVPTFVPLRADKGLTDQFRRKYRGSNSQPVIGITWGSKNERKEVPDLATWGRFVQAFPATFVSLQYGKIAPALRILRGDRAEKLIDDKSVDQMVDMDRFAAQVASLDAVLAISNTAAHLAGALDVPLLVIGDDKFRGQFPLEGAASGWYPSGIQVRKRGRDWRAVMDDAGSLLQQMLAR